MNPVAPAPSITPQQIGAARSSSTPTPQPTSNLTIQQIQAARASLTAAPKTNNGQPDSFGIGGTTDNPQSIGSSILSGFMDFTNNLSNETNKMNTLYANTTKDYSGDVNQISTGIQQNQAKDGTGDLNSAGGVAGLAADTINRVFAPITTVINAISDTASNNPSVQKSVSTPGVSNLFDFLNDKGGQFTAWAQKNPVAAKVLTDTITTGMGVVGEAGGGGEDITSPPNIASDVKNTVSNVAAKVSSGLEKAGAAITPSGGEPTDIISSRIKDATPSYDPKMNGTMVTNAQGERVFRIPEKGVGMNNEPAVVSSASETEAGTEGANIKNYPDNGIALEKLNATIKANQAEAESMRAGLQAEDKATPLDAQSQKLKIENGIQSNLPENIRAKLDVLSPEDKKFLSGMNEKAGLPQPKGGEFDVRLPGEKPGALPVLDKSAAGKYYTKVLDALNSYDGTREGTLDLRQAIDQAYHQEGGKYAQGSDSQSMLQETHTDIRDLLNKDLKNTTKNTDVQASLKRQTNLYRLSDVLNAKSQVESATALGRLEQQHPSLKPIINQFRRRGISIPIGWIGTIVGLPAVTLYLKSLLSGK